jgi:signal transduction histidine kinase
MRILTSHPVKVLGVLASHFFGAIGIFAQLASSQPIVLTNAEQIRNLSAAQANHSLQAQLIGVVVDESQPREHAVILADQTAGIYLTSVTNLFAPYHRFDVLSVSGTTIAGEFAPCVLTTEVHKIGFGPTPPARHVTYQQLITGALDAQLVEIRGVVRQCLPPEPDSDVWNVVLAADGGTVPVRLSLPQDPLVQPDAEVSIQAVCLYQFNLKRQLLNPVLQVPRGVEVKIENPQPRDPFAVPLQSSVSLLQFATKIPYGHRVHVRGIVTLSQPGSLVWIRDASSGLRIQTPQQDPLAAGDEIDVLGFPSYGASSPLLEDAIFKKIGRTIPPQPLSLTNFPDAFNNQDDLVSIEAKLLEVRPILDGVALTLEISGKSFNAILKQLPSSSESRNWQPGSLVRVAGICTVIYDDSRPVMGIWQPQSFQLLLRSSSDIVIIQPPPWWTSKHIMFSLGLLAAVSLTISCLVVWKSRRRIQEQTLRRTMAENEFAAILAERNRLAREIHDTLAQGLNATSVQLQLVEKHASGASEKMIEHLNQSKQLVRHSLEEARNSIWNMRSQVLESRDLAGALNNILEQMADDTINETKVEVTGSKRRLSPVIENNLLRIGQEAITNALKHAGAKHIKVKLDFGENTLSLIVADDGCGFDPANPRPSAGGFGLLGMKERARGLNSELKVRSVPNCGTEVQVGVSIPSPE